MQGSFKFSLNCLQVRNELVTSSPTEDFSWSLGRICLLSIELWFRVKGSLLNRSHIPDQISQKSSRKINRTTPECHIWQSYSYIRELSYEKASRISLSVVEENWDNVYIFNDPFIIYLFIFLGDFFKNFKHIKFYHLLLLFS